MSGQSRTDRFEGTDRFIVKRRLGRGGMGAVYEAFDQERGMEVALKTLVSLEPSSLLRFKQEFRALADVEHPNLVRLYELLSWGDQWFFTMELLRGRDIVSFLRGESPPKSSGSSDRSPQSADDPTLDTLPSDGGTSTRAYEPDPNVKLDYDRVRDTLRQLSLGVGALHERGYLHRDIKPSNVIVTDEGRVVLLDFGIIANVTGKDRATRAHEIVGTPAYMAPEQAANNPRTASDWYSVGAVMYRVLTGRPPFVGSMAEILKQKSAVIPPPPQLARTDVPDDLDRLCASLLQSKPHSRPTETQVISALSQKEPVPCIAPEGPDEDHALLIGREAHLEALRRAYERVAAGAGETVYVHGDSGMGKTALIRGFLNEATIDFNAVVLEGRCYERESVPYKAVDSLVDSLSRHLMTLPDNEADEIMPHGVLHLAKVFPVLRRVEAVAFPRLRSFSTPDPREVRVRAFEALRTLLSRMAEKRPLLLFIDDVQWGDADSAHLIDAVMRPPDQPAVLLVAAYRTADADRSPFVQTLNRCFARLGPAAKKSELAVEALPPGDARLLARALLERAGVATSKSSAVADESGGHPYFIQEIVRFLQAESADAETSPSLTLDAVIWKRIAELAAPARELMQAIAVAGKPIAQKVAHGAAKLPSHTLSPLIHKLRAAQLVRSTGVRGDDLVESYHERIRETVIGHLESAATVKLHRALAVALSATAQPDAETLAEHYEAAEERETAAEYVVRAAENAARTLSFLRAAQLYRRALELRKYPADEERGLTVKAADALANAGHGIEAAELYHQASLLASGAEALELRRLAGQYLLMSGRLDEGVERMDEVLRELGMKMPKSPFRGIASLLFRRAHLRLRGLRFRRRDPGEVAERDRLRVDACWSLGAALSHIDAWRGAPFATLGVIYACKTGDAFRAGRALMLETSLLASAGASARKKAERQASVAAEIAEELDNPHLNGGLKCTRGFIEFESGNFREGHENFEKAIVLLRERTTGTSFELGTSQTFSLVALLFLGQHAKMRRLAAPRLADAYERGDQYMSTMIRTLVLPVLYMNSDDPEGGIEEADLALREWGQEGFHNPKFNAVAMKAQCHLYRGEAAAAWALCCKHERDVAKSLLRFIQIIRGYWQYTRAISAVAMAAGSDDARALLKSAERDARRLEREKVTWCLGLGALSRGGISAVRGEPEKAMAHWRKAIELLDAAEMATHGGAVRRRLGALLGGDEGSALIEEGDRMLRDDGGFADTARATDGLAPSCSD